MGDVRRQRHRDAAVTVEASHRYSGPVFDDTEIGTPGPAAPPPASPRRSSNGAAGWAVAAVVVLILAMSGGLLTAWWLANSQSVPGPVALASATPSSSFVLPTPTAVASGPSASPSEGPHRTPTPVPTEQATPEPYVYVVQPGDHLINIADLYGVDVADIIALNDIKNANRLFVGQELLIPGYGTPPPEKTKKPRN